MNEKKFIQKLRLKKGALSRQLRIPVNENIPILLLNKIIAAKAGDTIINPTRTGKRRIKVTKLLEERAILAKTLKEFIRRKSRVRRRPTTSRRIRR